MGTVLLVVSIGAFSVATVLTALSASTSTRRLTLAMVGLGAVALFAATVRLVWAIWQLDFSFDYVSGQSRARSSGAYRLAALWGGADDNDLRRSGDLGRGGEVAHVQLHMNEVEKRVSR